MSVNVEAELRDVYKLITAHNLLPFIKYRLVGLRQAPLRLNRLFDVRACDTHEHRGAECGSRVCESCLQYVLTYSVQFQAQGHFRRLVLQTLAVERNVAA